MSNKNTNITKKDKIFWGIASILTLALLAWGYFDARKGDEEIQNFGSLTEGKVTNVYYLKNRGHYYNYEFIVEGKEYEGSEEYNSSKESPLVGMRVVVKYSSTNPRHSKASLEKISNGKSPTINKD